MEVALVSKVFRFLSYLGDRVRAQGVSHLPSFLYRRLRVELTERRYGIHTRGWIGSGSITPDPNCFDYDPLDYETIQVALATLDLENRKHVLLDYGCGKGRILAVASRYPFQRLLGVELSKYLCEVSEANLTAMRLPKLCANAQIVNADAREYEVPSDVTVIFLFNPFAGEVLDKVAHNIEVSAQKAARRLTVFHIHFRKVTSPFAALPSFIKKGELPLIFREEMVFEVFETASSRA